MSAAADELSGYFEAKEPGRRERADAWATAIGLQAVDGLKPSRFLVETAKDHIEGKISQSQARRRLHDYYAAKDETLKPDPELEEPDKVSERIVAVINAHGFDFTPEYYVSIHKKLFSGVLSSAGRLRTVNLGTHEWVLKEASVTYGDKDTLRASLARDFRDESEFDYGGKSPEEIIPHFVRFLAELWRVHPFMEGNTRTTAVFAIKYLRSLGYRATNNMFRENSWYFRNALVRANYADYAKGVKREWGYLEAFFRNLLLGEANELRSRYLLVGLGRPPPRFGGEKGREKSREKILRLLAGDPGLTQAGLAAAIGLSVKAVEKNICQLKAAGRLRRVGPDKGGHWEAVGEPGAAKKASRRAAEARRGAVGSRVPRDRDALGSARETFGWADMCRVRVPLPPLEAQRAIVDVYRCASEAKKIAAEADRLSREICPALVRRSGGRGAAPTERGRAKQGRQDRAGAGRDGGEAWRFG